MIQIMNEEKKCSWKWTSPIAVITTVGVSGSCFTFFTVPISSELNSYLLIMCIDAPESTTEFSLFCSRWSETCQHYFYFTRKIKRSSFVRILDLENVLHQFQRCFCGRIFAWCKVSSCDPSSNVGEQTMLRERTLLDTSSRWTASFTNFWIWARSAFGKLNGTNFAYPRRMNFLGKESWDWQHHCKNTKIFDLIFCLALVAQHVGDDMCRHVSNLFQTSNSDTWKDAKIWVTDFPEFERAWNFTVVFRVFLFCLISPRTLMFVAVSLFCLRVEGRRTQSPSSSLSFALVSRS